jgi:hypothetical protein
MAASGGLRAFLSYSTRDGEECGQSEESFSIAAT